MIESEILRALFLKSAREAIGQATTGRGLSQEAFARLCGWTGSMEYKYESGRSEIGEHVLDRVNEVLRDAGLDPAAVAHVATVDGE